MTQPANHDEPGKEHIIEFDMFVRDLAPEEEEKIKGGREHPKKPASEKDERRSAGD